MANSEFDNVDFVENNGILTEYKGKDAVIKIPANVMVIGEKAFSGTDIVAVDMGDNVHTVSDGAFEYCGKLQYIKINKSVNIIGNNAFAFCNNLQRVKFADGLCEIGSRAFYACESLEEITIPNTIININDEAFSKCSSLFSVTIPEGVEHLGEKLFSRCKDLMDIYLPNSLNDISADCFAELPPDTVVHVHKGSYAEKHCLRYRVIYNYDEILDCMIGLPNVIPEYSKYTEFIVDKSIVRTYKGKARKVAVPEGTKKVGSAAFVDNKYIEEIRFPDSVNEIGERAFTGCKSLSKIYFNDQINVIGTRAFSECPNLREIVLPKQLQKLNACVFEGDIGLNKISVPESVTDIDRNAFEGCDNITEITLPSQSYINLGAYFETKKKLQKVYVGDGLMYDEKAESKTEESKPGENLPVEKDIILSPGEQKVMDEALSIMADVHNNVSKYTDLEKKRMFIQALQLFEKLPQAMEVKEKRMECSDYIDIINCGFYQDALVLLESQNSLIENMGYILMSNISDKEIERTKHLHREWLKSKHSVVEQIRKSNDEARKTAEKQIKELENSILKCGIFDIVRKVELKSQLELVKNELVYMEDERKNRLEQMGVNFEEDTDGISKMQEEVIHRRFPDVNINIQSNETADEN